MDESRFPARLPPFPDVSPARGWRNGGAPASSEARARLWNELDEACTEFEYRRWDYSSRASEYHEVRKQLQEESRLPQKQRRSSCLSEYEQLLVTAMERVDDSRLAAERARRRVAAAHSNWQLRTTGRTESPVLAAPGLPPPTR